MNKILICGSRGFIGKNLKEYLNTPEEPFVDYTNYAETAKVVRDLDCVFICCAKSFNGFVAKDNPQSMILPNLQMVSNILESSLKNGVKKVVYISSSTVYQPSYKLLFEEDLDLNINPHNCWMGVGWMKRYAEKLCEFYSKQGLNVVVVRPTNVYGKWDKKDETKCHVIPAMIMRAKRMEDPFIIYGNGRAVKDLIFVEDFVRDLADVAFLYNSPDPINISSGELLSLNEIAGTIIRQVGYEPSIKHIDTNIEQVPFKGISNNKLLSLFGQRPYYNFTVGLKRTINWYS